MLAVLRERVFGGPLSPKFTSFLAPDTGDGLVVLADAALGYVSLAVLTDAKQTDTDSID
jgi:hypothetical protein